MQSTAATPDEYLASLPEDRRKAMQELRKVMKQHLPEGFAEVMSYGMIGYVVPHSRYPDGYHCNPKLPLPFINIASQKNYIAVYHMGVYANEQLLNWFVSEYNKLEIGKLDMGKGCMRFKKIDKIPFSLLGKLAEKISVSDWIGLYEQRYKK